MQNWSSTWGKIDWKQSDELVEKQVSQMISSADINGTDPEGNTPLIYAVLKGHNKTASLLIKNKADVNARNCTGFTALMAACHSGREDLVQLLLENNADKNICDNYKKSPAFYARKKPNILKLLGISEDEEKKTDKSMDIFSLMLAIRSFLVSRNILNQQATLIENRRRMEDKMLQ